MHSTPIAHCACSFSPAYGAILHHTVAPAVGRPPSTRHVTHENTNTSFHRLRVTHHITSQSSRAGFRSCPRIQDKLSEFSFAVSFHRQYPEAATRFSLPRSSSHHNQLPTPAPSHSDIPPFYIPRYLPSSRLALQLRKPSNLQQAERSLFRTLPSMIFMTTCAWTLDVSLPGI
ncbi:hypothetical protein BDN70DRAFT_108705 [Pholiota conissans]|uniref:Uncharacterized protein n=1 Tax=Pholiota conissans TaxID=109636 RepID=A0A9P5Z108_9AGAR|nr:hypothetical protein BDN70DRAFT_108705 [Pholiota conissans]